MPKPTGAVSMVERPPIIVVMGHIDHGKSTLLDYIRKTNVVAEETGGITQHISAYEVIHEVKGGGLKKITFLDTPGHEAFSAMRTRSAQVADIAILVVSAEESIKPQTLEALEAIKQAGIPFIVAINKIDKPAANIQKVKNEITEKGILIEEYGGDVPCIPLSAVTGQGMPDLLDMILLVAEMRELRADTGALAHGIVIEAHVDPRAGVTATLVITDGTLKKGMHLVAGRAISPVRAITDCRFMQVAEATVSSPISITGFTGVPAVGTMFQAYETRKEAEQALGSQDALRPRVQEIIGNPNAEKQIPILLKADVLGSLDAMEKEAEKTLNDKVAWKIITRSAGDITENDVKIAAGSPDSFIIGFRATPDNKAKHAAEIARVPIHTFGIIYNMTDFLEGIVKERTPREQIEEATGSAKILRAFSKTKEKQVLGGKVLTGSLPLKGHVKIMRRDAEIGRGTIVQLQKQKIAATEVKEGDEFGVMIESKIEIAPGDRIETFIIVTR